ncbi:MAG TPA: isoprenylcysteine carboxylmethyltransferase family protein [Anaerolineales bacterium]
MYTEISFRIAALVIFLTGVSISIYHRRKADVESEETVSARDEGRLMFLSLRLGGLVLWFSVLAYLINPDWLAWSRIGLPAALRWAGVGLGLICDLLILWLFRSLGNSISPTVATRREHRLVTMGPYRYVRHPLYSVGTLFFLSLALMADSWFIGVLAILALMLLRLRIPNEEAHLVARFGDEYRAYRQTTGMLLPRIGARSLPAGDRGTVGQ